MSATRPDPDAPLKEPWQAELHALTVALHERGLFGWSEWTTALSTQLHAPDAAPDGSDYWHRWLDALAALLHAKGVADVGTVHETAEAWKRAAAATPHGEPIELANDPLSDAARSNGLSRLSIL